VETKTTAFAEYLKCRDKSGRLRQLAQLSKAREHDSGDKNGLPISLAEDLLALELGNDEKLAILEATGSKDGLALEHFLTNHLFDWSQDLASLAVRLWAGKTDHLLWFRILQASRSPLLPQRVLYTIIDHAFVAGGRRLLAPAAASEATVDMSPAFHGLILHRCTQWGIAHERLGQLAASVVSGISTHLHPENKALPSALAYIARFTPDEITTMAASSAVAEPWRDLLRCFVLQSEQWDKQQERLAKLVQKPPKTKAFAKLEPLWPPVWQRHRLDADTVAGALRLVLDDEASARRGDTPSLISSPWEFFSGIAEATLDAALGTLTDDKTFARATSYLGGLLPTPTPEAFLTKTKARLAASADPAGVLQALPLRLRLEMTDDSAREGGKRTPFAQMKTEEAAVLAGTPLKERPTFADYDLRANQPGREELTALASRKAFFDLAYRGRQDAKQPGTDGFWHLLSDAWRAPAEPKLAPLAQAARQVEGVLRLCYVNTLGRFKGHDQAALKILDFIRSKEEDDLRAVVYALGGIGTPRAMQELVSALTRPNVTSALQLEICGILEKQDLSNLQNELRSAINDLTVTPAAEGPGWDVREALASLLNPTQAVEREHKLPDSVPQTAVSDQHLDQVLGGKIQHYRELSSEVKRALRTSQFFHFQVQGNNAPESIDLSPVIDMQYKALELLFRETFEEPCSRLIHRGVLQRRLDVIGYARPIPRSMDEFEAYIASLPTIRDIPFFSKFKLRKMLRAICQFRPGKRFTLDGLKAFALFFLCFSRSECRYGLGGLFPMGFATDAELFSFCKALHVLQDFRNRAAHEGFHPDASNDIDGIWRATAEIVQTMFKAHAFVEAEAQAEFAPRSKSAPVIEKKVS
jgi:hypothetical protein